MVTKSEIECMKAIIYVLEAAEGAEEVVNAGQALMNINQTVLRRALGELDKVCTHPKDSLINLTVMGDKEDTFQCGVCEKILDKEDL